VTASVTRQRFVFASLTIAACASRPAVTVPAPPPQPEHREEVAAVETAEQRDAKLVAEATEFVAEADHQLRRAMVTAALAEWDEETDGTDAHKAAAATANDEQSRAITALMTKARTYAPVMAKLDPLVRRQLVVLVDMLPVMAAVQPAPPEPKLAEDMAQVAENMGAIYAAASSGSNVCPANDPDASHCKNLQQLSHVLQTSRKPADLLAAWQGWHDTVGHGERDLFAKYVQLANAGARAVGFADVAELWQSGYDMPADAFAADTERLWQQVKPLYTQLHCYARRKLAAVYGDKLVPKTGLIPAHLLGNMWAQSWTYLYPELEPYGGVARIDATAALKKSYDATKMVKMGEAFYTSLGMAPLPDTFWQRSMLTRPPGREVECHASSWDPMFADDLRLKMCIEPTHEDLVTIHHELGHSYYFQAYYKLPIILQNGANDGFHEAIGDTIALSMTPGYLHDKGLLDKVVDSDKATIDQLMLVALDKIAFLPFGLLIDRWRWDVFAGKVSPAQYNAHWWELRAQYQGVAPPVSRGPDDFDPGAKYHVASNTPYMRYFLARILQFQFHKALCAKAGFTGPLHACSIYDNKTAGAALQDMLAVGASQPWQDTLYQLTGQRDMDASALLEYFAPLERWLEDQNKGQSCGW
jgi:peptidyl-dipeptidase A